MGAKIMYVVVCNLVITATNGWVPLQSVCDPVSAIAAHWPRSDVSHYKVHYQADTQDCVCTMQKTSIVII